MPAEVAMGLEDQSPRRVSEYREFMTRGPLATNFRCLWSQTISGFGGVYQHRVLPDGCIDIVFINEEPPVLVGPWTVSLVAQLPAPSTITGARLHPGRAACLLGIPASEMLNQSVPIAAVKGAAQNIRFEEVMQQPNAAARRRALAQALLRSMEPAVVPDHAVVAGIEWLSRHPQSRIQQLSRWIGISERQLHRRFLAAIGYGPKMFQSVLRFQRLLKAGRELGAWRGLAELAAIAGYADQAHMTRDVQRFAKVRPTELLRSAESTR